MNLTGETLPNSGCVQRSSASNPVSLPRAGLDHRLIGEVHLAAFERLAQRHLQHAPLLRLDVELRLVGAVDAAAGVLGAVEREVGGADQHLRGAPVARARREPDDAPMWSVCWSTS